MLPEKIGNMAGVRAVAISASVLLILSYAVYRDSKRCGSDYAIWWGITMVFANIFGPIGFAYYLYHRYQTGGDLK